MAGSHGTSGPARREETWTERLVARVSTLLAREAWRPGRLRARGAPGAFFRACRIVWLAGRGFTRDQCVLRAAALTYVTVLSLVPLLALSFSVAKGLGFYQDLLHETINPFLDRTFGPLDAVAPMLEPSEGGRAMRLAIHEVLSFVDRTQVSALGAVGLVLLIWTSLKLLGSVERTFNGIWGVDRARSLVRKLTDYLAMVVVTPILLFAATGLTTAVGLTQAAGGAGAGGWLSRVLQDNAGLARAVELALSAVPLLAIWLGFTFLYYALPNARTRLSSALVGGLVAGVLWQLALMLHIRFQVGVARYDAIYSSFALIPIFLVWLNLSWIIVLLGAEVCFAHQSEGSYVEAPGARGEDVTVTESIGLRSVLHVATTFLRGAPPVGAEEIAERLGLPLRSVTAALDQLAASGILAAANESEGASWILARDPGLVRVLDVLDSLRGSGERTSIPVRSPSDAEADRVLRGLEQEQAGSRHNQTLRELAEAAIRTEDAQRAEASGAGTPRVPLAGPTPQRAPRAG